MAEEDGIDIPIDVRAGDGAEVATRVAEAVAALRKELEQLYRTQNSSDAKAAAAAAKEAQKQLNDQLRASAINLANSRRAAAAEDRAAAKQQADELKASAINIRNLRQQAAAEEKAARQAAAAEARALREKERAAERAQRAEELAGLRQLSAARRAANAAERAANKQLDDERKASARNLTVLRQKARQEERQAAAEERAQARAAAELQKQQVAQERAHVAAIRQASTARQQAIRETEAATRAAAAQRAAVASLVRQLILLASAYVGARTFKAFIDAGLQFNETIETANLGVASLITSQSKMTDSQGTLIQGTEKLSIAQGLAEDQVNKLRIAGLKSVATTQQLVFAFQQATGVGLRWGLTLDQIRVITVQVAQAAGALGVPLNQLNEEIRSLLTGTITPRNTRIATALGITNEQIKQAQAAGNLFDFVTKRLEAFSTAGEATARTFRGVMSNIREALENLAGDATKPLFETLRVSGQEALEGMFDLNTARISSKLQGIVSLAQDIFGDVADTIGSAMTGAVEAAESLSEWLDQNAVQVRLLANGFENIGSEVVGILRDVTALVGQLTQSSIETGNFQRILNGASLVLADIRTIFDAIVAAAGAIGAIILKSIITPFTFFLRIVAKGAGVFKQEWADSLNAVADEADAWIDNIGSKVRQFGFDKLAPGNTATERLSAKLQQQRDDAEANVEAQAKLRNALALTAEYEKTTADILDESLKRREITQDEYQKRSKQFQTIILGQQIRAQQEYLKSLSVENEGDRSRTRELINELVKRKNALQRGIKLDAIAPPPDKKVPGAANDAAQEAAAQTKLIKAELANRLKDLKILLDNQRVSYRQYYADVTQAQQDAIDRQIAVQKKLLGSTSDAGARSKILADIKVLEGERTQVVEDNLEKQRQDELKLAQDVTSIHVQLLKDQGRLSEARVLEIGDKYRKLIAQLKAEGNQAGADIVERLFNIDNAKTRLDELMNQAKTVQEVLGTRLDEIQVESATHAINERQAREAIVEAYKGATTQLEAMLPAMRQAAALTEDPAQVAAVDALATKIRQMNLTVQQQTSDWFILKEASREALKDGLVEFIDQAAEGAKSLAELWREVAGDIVGSLRRIAAQMLANIIIEKSMQYLSAATGFLSNMIFSDISVAGALAEGGYVTGPGTSTSDSIPARLSNGEYVIRADAVKAVGLDLLHAINSSGSSNIVPRHRLRGYAEGGLVSAADGSKPGGFDATLGLEEGLVVRHIKTRPGTEAVLSVLASNRNAVKRILGG